MDRRTQCLSVAAIGSFPMALFMLRSLESVEISRSLPALCLTAIV